MKRITENRFPKEFRISHLEIIINFHYIFFIMLIQSGRKSLNSIVKCFNPLLEITIN